MSIDENVVRKVAGLARLQMTPEEITQRTPQVAGIMKWIEMLGEVDTDKVEPLANVVQQKLKLRADNVSDGGYQQAVLANAPEAVEGFFVVPKVVE